MDSNTTNNTRFRNYSKEALLNQQSRHCEDIALVNSLSLTGLASASGVSFLNDLQTESLQTIAQNSLCKHSHI